MQNMKALGFKI